MAQGFALIMTWPIVSPPFLAGLLAARNTLAPVHFAADYSDLYASIQ